MCGHQRRLVALYSACSVSSGVRVVTHPEPVRDAMDVRVDADVLLTLERQDQHEVGRLPADAGQRQQLLHRARHAAAELLDQDAARLLHVRRLVAIEADRIDRAAGSLVVRSLAIVRGVRATRNSRADAAAVTGSRVCADSIVETSTSNGSSWLSSAIFSTAGRSRSSIARASVRMTVWTDRAEGFGMSSGVSALAFTFC